MPKKTDTYPKTAIISAIGAIVIIAIAGGLWYMLGQTKSGKKTSPDKITVPIEPEQVIDYAEMDKDDKLKDLMKTRKDGLGVGEGIDIIAKSNESVKVGGSTVAMSEIMEKIQLKIGDIVERNLAADDTDPGESIKDFGIYVVQPGDNIWNIHFRFLRNYFERKGIALSPLSDEPNSGGKSTGVGKLLKFSENIVYIYNMEKRDLDIDLNLIHPLTKLVIYNMDRIFALLDRIDTDKVDRIHFDGETLWLPAEE